MTKQKRPAPRAQVAGVAGSAAELGKRVPDVLTPLPSELAIGPTAERVAADGGIAITTLLLSAVIGLALALSLLAAIPTRQLAVLPASRWIARRRLDLMIGGMGVIAAVLGVLLISAVLGP